MNLPVNLPVNPPADPFAAVAALPGVAEAIAAARAAVDAALAHRLMRRRSAEVQVEAGLRSARASAALEGTDLDLDTLRRWSPPRAGGPPPVIAGALRLSAEYGSVLTALDRAPLQAFARLHVLAAADAAGQDALGRPRSGPVEDELGLGPAPEASQIGPRLAALADLLVTKTAAPALAVSAVVHGELLALRPFGWGNGLVARAAGRLVLVNRGLDTLAVTAPEVGHADDPAAYTDAAAAYLGGDVASWVVHCARAAELGARETLAICAAIERSASA